MVLLHISKAWSKCPVSLRSSTTQWQRFVSTGNGETQQQQPVDSNVNSEPTTHYGFETVSVSEKAKRVHSVFEGVASKYDLMNDFMSAGVHRLWKDHFVHKMKPLRSGTKVLDVAGGTGDIAFRIAKHLQMNSPAVSGDNPSSTKSQIVICDINQAMLDVGKKRAADLNFDSDSLSWLCADAQKLPIEDESFDLYTIAFGIRNVVDVQLAINEAYRVLRPGGRFMCLEFSHVSNPAIKWIYDTYSFQVIPPMGELVAGDWKSYQYLVESIRKFPKQDDFKCMIESAGFRCATYQNLTFGIVSIHSGFKI